jgi:hypothetical protein
MRAFLTSVASRARCTQSSKRTSYLATAEMTVNKTAAARRLVGSLPLSAGFGQAVVPRQRRLIDRLSDEPNYAPHPGPTVSDRCQNFQSLTGTVFGIG